MLFEQENDRNRNCKNKNVVTIQLNREATTWEIKINNKLPVRTVTQNLQITE